MKKLSLLLLLILPTIVYAGVPRTPSNSVCGGNVALCNFLSDLYDHLNTLECVTSDPNGNQLGVHGELVCGDFNGNDYICMNTGTGPNKTTSWTCLDIAGAGAKPTAGIFCPGELSTAMACEEYRTIMPADCTASAAYAQVTTAPIGSRIGIEVQECTDPGNCQDLLGSNREIQIPEGQLSGSIVFSTVNDDTFIPEGNYIGFEFNTVGSDFPGQDLSVNFICQ